MTTLRKVDFSTAPLFDARPGDCAVILGDADVVLRTLDASTFRCCVTSPPYWGLRDYGFSDQIGAEPSLDEYLSRLRGVFREVQRVLTDDGTLWLNVGDGYTSGNRAWRDNDKKNPARAMTYRPRTPPGLKPKDLIGIPWRLAFALQEDGWQLRADIVWHKPNCQPESVKDRPTRCHEYVFLFSKSEQYYYDYKAVKEDANEPNGSRNRRTVWSINTEASPGAHFATFPPKLVELCVLAGSKRGDKVHDPFFGSGTVGVVSLQLGRTFLGVELKKEYVRLAHRRLGWSHSDRRNQATEVGPARSVEDVLGARDIEYCY